MRIENCKRCEYIKIIKEIGYCMDINQETTEEPYPLANIGGCGIYDEEFFPDGAGEVTHCVECGRFFNPLKDTGVMDSGCQRCTRCIDMENASDRQYKQSLIKERQVEIKRIKKYQFKKGGK